MSAQSQEDRMIETKEITEMKDLEEILTEIERKDLLSATTANRMVIFLKTVKMKKLKDLTDLTEDKIKESDVTNVRNSVIWLRTVPNKVRIDQEETLVVREETIERRSASSVRVQATLLKTVM